MSTPEKNPVVPTLQAPSREQLVETLRRRIAAIEGSGGVADGRSVSSGCPPLDRLLPGGGLRWGTLVEWLAADPGSGAQTLAFYAAREAEACRDGGVLVVLDPAKEFYPPAAARLGIPLEKTLVVQAACEADNLWALDQVLRAPAVAAAVACLERLPQRTFRRLQLAAEQGGGLGLLVRPEHARREPSWADVRLLVTPRTSADRQHGRRLKIEVLRSRQPPRARHVELEIDDETRTVHLAPPLAHPTTRRRAAGA